MAMASSCRLPAPDARWPRRPPHAKRIATCRTRSTDDLPAQQGRREPLDGLEVRYQDVAPHLLDPDLVEGRRLQDLRIDLRVPRAAGNLCQGRDLVLGNVSLQAVQRAEKCRQVDLGLGVVEPGQEGAHDLLLTGGAREVVGRVTAAAVQLGRLAVEVLRTGLD